MSKMYVLRCQDRWPSSERCSSKVIWWCRLAPESIPPWSSCFLVPAPAHRLNRPPVCYVSHYPPLSLPTRQVAEGHQHEYGCQHGEEGVQRGRVGGGERQRVVGDAQVAVQREGGGQPRAGAASGWGASRERQDTRLRSSES